MLENDAKYFLKLQTQTGWGRTLQGFAYWCAPEPGWRTLDVGCGPGLLPAIFAHLGCRAMGVDIDREMFQPQALHPVLALADVHDLPFEEGAFDLVTASNLVFLLEDPVMALRSMRRILAPNGRLAMLNPSEGLNPVAAKQFADETGMEGLARDTLLNWARRAMENHRWNEVETYELYRQAGMTCMGSITKVGPGFGRFSSGVAQTGD